MLSMNGTNVFAYDLVVENADGKKIYYNYINNHTELEVTFEEGSNSSNSYGGNIVIPEEVTFMNRTRKVTAIGDYAFYNYGGRGRTPTSITIPKSVKYIGKDAFSSCQSMKSVLITDLVAWCNVEIKSSPLFYAHYLYVNGICVKDLVIPNGVSSIRENAFSGCSLESVTIPSSVTSIGDFAFSESNMISLTIGDGVTSIGKNAFSNCNRLKKVSIPKSVTSLGNSAFSGCKSLTSVKIGNNVSAVADKAFKGCTGLISLTIGKNVTSIGQEAFSDCTSLPSVIIPNSVSTIDYAAFHHCKSMTSITIGTGVKTVGNSAFGNCPLNAIYISDVAAWCNIDFKDTNPLYKARHLYINGEEVKNLEIPYGVTAISKGAFQNCSSLISVIIPQSVKSIGKDAFGGIDIQDVVSLIKNPFKIDDVFSNNTFNNATLYVPVGTIKKYQEKEGWKKFWYIKEGTGPYHTCVKKAKADGGDYKIFDVGGKPLKKLQKGVNIIRYNDGRNNKVIVKH